MIVYNNQQQLTRLCSFQENFVLLQSPLRNNGNQGQHAIMIYRIFIQYFCLFSVREERAKRLDGSSSNTDLPVIVTPKKTTEKPSTVTPKKLNLDRPNSVSEVIIADASEVTHSDKLDVLSDLYSSLLDGNEQGILC